MELYAIEEQRKVDLLVEAYKRVFKEVFEVDPVIPNGARDSLLTFVRQWAGDKKKADGLMRRYFALDDDWLRGAGYPLKQLPNRYNAIAVSYKQEKPKKTRKLQWVDGNGNTGEVEEVIHER